MKLKKCPFCGSEANLNDVNEYGYGCSNMMCELSCKEIATVIWNTRPIEDKLQAELAMQLDRLSYHGELKCVDFKVYAKLQAKLDTALQNKMFQSAEIKQLSEENGRLKDYVLDTMHDVPYKYKQKHRIY